MIEACPAVPPGAGFIGSMVSYADCQARVLGSGAWSALSAPGSSLSVVLTGLLTIFIAVIGYELLLGRRMSVREGTLAFVKIGAVFALATSWPAYRTLVYDLVVDGPSQLVAEIGPQAGVAGSDGTLLQRLDLADQTMARLAILGPGAASPEARADVPPPPFGGFDSFALGSSQILFELTAVAGLGIVRIVAGLMLALGPFFIAFLMFENTRSLFEGWVRVLGGAALASVGVAIALGLELALLEPWLSSALARRMAGEALPEVSTQLFVIACLFAMVVAAAFYACARTVWAFRLAPALRPVAASARTGSSRLAEGTANDRISLDSAERERSRAAAVAAMLVATSRRERVAAAPASAAFMSAGSRAAASAPADGRPATAVPVGRSFTRRPGARLSAVAARRDGGQ